jgi:hypothetical protein
MRNEKNFLPDFFFLSGSSALLDYNHHNAKGLSLSDENLLPSSQLLSWTLVDLCEVMIVF